MAGEWVKEITGTRILRLGKWKHSLDFIKETIKIKEFSNIHMDGHNSLVLRLRLFCHDLIYEDYSYLQKFPWRKWLLCSPEKWNGVLYAFAALNYPPRLLLQCHQAARKLSNILRKWLWLTKDIILHMQYEDFPSPIVSITQPPASCRKGRTKD